MMVRGANEAAIDEEASNVLPLSLTLGSAGDRDPDAVDFLRASGLSLSNVVVSLMDQSDDCIKIISPDGHLQFMSCNGRKAMEVDDFSAIAGARWDSLWPEDSRQLVRDSVASARKGGMARFEAFCPTAKGDPRWWEVTVSPVESADGTVGAILSSSRDVTERRNREEALATVAHEMKHRLRNAHAVSAAIAMASAADSPEQKQFCGDLADRLSRLADVQANLIDTAGMPLRKLCEDATGVFANGKGHVGDLPDVMLHDDGARALAMVLGELATNSMKYGALGRSGEARLEGRIEDGRLLIGWTETFDPATAPALGSRSSSGQGRGLMERMLRILGGSFSGEARDDGYSARIEAPLARVRAKD